MTWIFSFLWGRNCVKWGIVNFHILWLSLKRFDLILLVTNIYTVRAASWKYCSWWCQWWKIDLLWFWNDGEVFSLSSMAISNMNSTVAHALALSFVRWFAFLQLCLVLRLTVSVQTFEKVCSKHFMGFMRKIQTR